MRQAAGSWGNFPRASQGIIPLRSRFDALPAANTSCLPFGNGRSYGDVCLNDGGALLTARGLDRLIRFDTATGELECEAGVLLSELIAFTLPHGWFPAVTPGTQFVTVGGAIANDVHGKNHHRSGSFGHHVLGFELLRSDGRTLECDAQHHPELFHATIGGLGLTGLIRHARLQLAPVPGSNLEGDSIRFGGLDEFFELSRESDASHEHTVAWVDCLARGSATGRGIFHRANWSADAAASKPRRNLAMPFTPPVSLVNRVSAGLFNRVNYRWHRAGEQRRRWHYQPFFYPLDGILHWNRMYGPRGFLQYQCVLPKAGARDALREMLSRIAVSGQASFLAVLKTFGDAAPAGLMSFTRPGVTLAVDFPQRGAQTLRLLESLDVITRAAGGAVYPAKDARMSPESFAAYFPQWRTLERLRDPAISSSFWRRVTGALT